MKTNLRNKGFCHGDVSTSLTGLCYNAKAHDICMEMCISIAFLYRMKAAYNHVTSPQKASRSTHAKEKGRESLRKIFVPPLFAPHLILVVVAET